MGVVVEDLALVAPEVEAKFLIPTEAVRSRLLSLAGRELRLRGPCDEVASFTVERDQVYVYEDKYFDVPRGDGFALLCQRGLLRQRIRRDELEGFALAYVNLQAKNAPSSCAGLHAAVFARNEVRGPKQKDLEAFERALAATLAPGSKDPAVSYARTLVGSDDGFVPVLSSKATRWFMKVLENGRPPTPAFWLSVDQVDYEALYGSRRRSAHLEFEAEMVGATTRQLDLLQSLSCHLRDEFGLVETGLSKYEVGMAAVR